jgi:CheY-like chemotaxis protein
MPELDGLAATAQIRADARFDALPIIAMTAHATLEERERCLAAGMQDHIAKPIDPAVLFGTVRHHARPAPAVVPVTPSPAVVTPPAPVGSTPTTPTDGLSSQEQPSAADPALPAVDGLDTADGLLRLGGNRALYLKLLRQFVEQQAAAPAELAALLAAGDLATAERQAHTIKGVAGNLGAGAVQAAAAALERALGAPAPAAELEAARLELAHRLTTLLDGLRPALVVEPATAPGLLVGVAAVGANSAVPPTGAVPDAAALRPVIEQMQAYLGDFDAAAVDYLAAHRALFQALFAPEALAQFQAHVEAFAFEDARDQLAAAADGLQARAADSAPAGSPSDERTVDATQIQAAIQQMQQYLAEFDAAAVDYLDAQSALFRALFPPAAFAEFQHSVETYAFAEAMARLDEAGRQDDVVSYSSQAFPSAPVAAETVDPQVAQQAIAQMRQHLADWDVAAVDHLAAHRAFFRARFSPEAFAEFERRVTSFAFGEAQVQLEEATDSHAD